MQPERHRPRPPDPDPVALPGEDELPFDFGPNLETEQHRLTMTALIHSLRLWLSERGIRDVYVNGNMALYFSAAQVRSNDFLGPDVLVVKNTSLRRRKSWVVWEERRTPDVVIELISGSTEARDRGDKMIAYAQALSVSEYYLFDPITGVLEGYRLDPRHHRYVVIPRDADECLSCEQLGLRLGVRWVPDGEEYEEPLLRWRERSGEWVLTPEERAEAERARAEAERTRAEAERARADALAERLRALGIDPDAS